VGIEEWRGEESRQDILIPLNKWMSRDSKGHPVQFDLYDGKTGRWRMSIQQNEWNQIWAAICAAYPELAEQYGTPLEFVRSVVGSIGAGILNDPKVAEHLSLRGEEIRQQVQYRLRDQQRERLMLNFEIAFAPSQSTKDQLKMCEIILAEFDDYQLNNILGSRTAYQELVDHYDELRDQ